jgi:hypothetical protein
VPLANAQVFTNALPLQLPVVAEQGANKGFARLWVDRDRDGVWTTNDAVALQAGHGRALPRFDVALLDGGVERRIEFSGSLYSERYLMLSHEASFEGKAQFAGAQWRAHLQDADCDGVFIEFLGKTTDAQRPGAMLQLALESGAATAPTIDLPLARTMGIGDRFYEVALAYEGDSADSRLRLTLRPVQRPTGEIALTGKDVESVILAGDETALWLSAKHDRVGVPAGTFAVQRVIVSENGVRFASRGRDPGPRFRDEVTVTAGQTTQFAAGGPLKHAVSMRGNWSMGTLWLSLSPSKDAGGRDYYPFVGNPGWVVRRPGGSTIAAGDFQYG